VNCIIIDHGYYLIYQPNRLPLLSQPLRRALNGLPRKEVPQRSAHLSSLRSRQALRAQGNQSQAISDRNSFERGDLGHSFGRHQLNRRDEGKGHELVGSFEVKLPI
jgi:hypothetical protein